MSSPSLFDRAKLWGGLGVGLATVGGILLGIWVPATKPPPWLVTLGALGIALLVLAILAFLWSAILAVAHAHNDRQHASVATSSGASGSTTQFIYSPTFVRTEPTVLFSSKPAHVSHTEEPDS